MPTTTTGSEKRRNTQTGRLSLAWAASILLALAPVVWLYQRGEHLQQRLALSQQEAVAAGHSADQRVQALEHELATAQGALDAARRQIAEQKNTEAAPATDLQTLRRRLDLATAPAVGLPVLHLSPVRSIDDRPAHRLTLDQNPEWVVVILEPTGTSEIFDVLWRDPEGKTLLHRGDLEMDAYGALTLSIYSPDLKTGVHQVTVTGKSGGPKQEMRLEVSRP